MGSVSDGYDAGPWLHELRGEPQFTGCRWGEMSFRFMLLWPHPHCISLSPHTSFYSHFPTSQDGFHGDDHSNHWHLKKRDANLFYVKWTLATRDLPLSTIHHQFLINKIFRCGSDNCKCAVWMWPTCFWSLHTQPLDVWVGFTWAFSRDSL